MTLCVLCMLASPLESAVPKNGSATPLKSALTESLDLKPPEINTYRKEGVAPRSSAKLTSTGAQTRIPLDRKSTRLNSSHVRISYAVFCLKKKKKVHTG